MSNSIGTATMQQAMLSQNIGKTPSITATNDDKKLKEQTDAFEAVIVKMMLDDAMKNEKSIFSSQNDPGDKMYQSMYRDELSKQSAGSFGFSQMLFDYLKQKNGKTN